jgi:hypothetical protein
VRPLGWLLEGVMHRKVTNDMRQTFRQGKRIIEQEAAAREPTDVRPLQTDQAPAPSR